VPRTGIEGAAKQSSRDAEKWNVPTGQLGWIRRPRALPCPRSDAARQHQRLEPITCGRHSC
jgi:hypothetical protein